MNTIPRYIFLPFLFRQHEYRTPLLILLYLPNKRKNPVTRNIPNYGILTVLYSSYLIGILIRLKSSCSVRDYHRIEFAGYTEFLFVFFTYRGKEIIIEFGFHKVYGATAETAAHNT